MACWEERPQVCAEIRLALAMVRRRTPLAGVRGTPGGRRQGPSSVGPRQALLLLLLLLLPPSHPPSLPPTLPPSLPPSLPPLSGQVGSAVQCTTQCSAVYNTVQCSAAQHKRCSAAQRGRCGAAQHSAVQHSTRGAVQHSTHSYSSTPKAPRVVTGQGMAIEAQTSPYPPPCADVHRGGDPILPPCAGMHKGGEPSLRPMLNAPRWWPYPPPCADMHGAPWRVAASSPHPPPPKAGLAGVQGIGRNGYGILPLSFCMQRDTNGMILRHSGLQNSSKTSWMIRNGLTTPSRKCWMYIIGKGKSLAQGTCMWHPIAAYPEPQIEPQIDKNVFAHCGTCIHGVLEISLVGPRANHCLCAQYGGFSI